MAEIRELATERGNLMLEGRERQAAIMLSAPLAQTRGTGACRIKRHAVSTNTEKAAIERPFCCSFCYLTADSDLFIFPSAEKGF